MKVDIKNIDSVLSFYSEIDENGLSLFHKLDNTFVEKVALLINGINKGFFWFKGVSKCNIPPVTGYSMNPDSLQIIIDHILKNKPKTIVEFGSGLSTVVISQILSESLPHSHLYSFDGEVKYQNELTQFLKDQISYKHERVSLFESPLEEIEIEGNTFLWYDTSVITSNIPKTVDMLIVDGPQGYLNPLARFPALKTIKEFLSPKACIFLDDSNRPDEKEIISLWKKDIDCSVTHYNTTEGIDKITLHS